MTKIQGKDRKTRVENYPHVGKSCTATEELKDLRRYWVLVAKGKVNVYIPEGRPVWSAVPIATNICVPSSGK